MTDQIDVSRWPAPQEGETHEQLKIMLSGQPYIAVDPYLSRIREMMAAKMFEYNQERSEKKKAQILESMATLRPKAGVPQNVNFMTPFTFEYGFNLNLGTDIYVGPNGQFIDVNESKPNSNARLGDCLVRLVADDTVYIGDRSMLGANVQIYTPAHPISPEARNGLKGPEWAKRIRIGDDCWIGGGVIIVPGVTIGNGVTIGAGSVVTKDIPDRTVAVGNPARVIKKINADGSTETVARA